MATINRYIMHSLNCTPSSLIVDHTLRPTPKEMLTHPWIASVMKKEVPMGRWIREVWGWRSTQSTSVYVLSRASCDTSLMVVHRLALALDLALVEVLALQHPRNFST